MKPIEIRKCEKKISNIINSIKSKEIQKNDLQNQIDTLKKQLRQFGKERRKLIDQRNVISEDIKIIRDNLRKTHDEMNRIKAGLIYKTKQEYNDMIKKFENEMRFNTRQYNSNEEARLLKDIKTHQQGIKQFEIYEGIKQNYENLSDTYTNKKHEHDDLWKQVNEIKTKIDSENEKLRDLDACVKNLDKEISDLMSQKFDAKKELEDLNRENLLKHQQAKKEEKALESCSYREDDVITSMDYTIREYNKLINYFNKLQNGEEAHLLIPNGTFLNASTPTASFSLTHSFELACRNDKPTKPTSLSLRYKSEDFGATQTPLGLAQTPTYPLLTTPTHENGANAQFLLKKKSDDEESNFLQQKRRSSKKPKQIRSIKVSHPVEVIQLLDKLNVPIVLSSQIDECLKLLNQKRFEIIHQLEEYKLNLNTEKQEQCYKNENESEISSCIDSLYESDTSSVSISINTQFDNTLTLTPNDAKDLLAKRKNSKSNSSSSSDKTVKQQSPTIDLTQSVLNRQISDGYSSTPLSADSFSSEINKETANPFFKNVNF